MSRVFHGSLRHGHNRGLLLGLLVGGLLGSVFMDGRLGCSLAGDVAQINIRCRTNKRRDNADIKICIKKDSAEDTILNLQVGAPVRRCVEPSLGPPSHCRRLSFSKTHWLDVRRKRVTGYPNSVDRRDVGAAPWSPDQGRSSLVLFIAVVDDPHEPAVDGS